MEKQKIKGYKVFNPDFTCRGMQYAENKLFRYSGEIKICESGLHFCEKASDCFSYYKFNADNIVCEVESRGKTEKHKEDSKVVTDTLWVGRKLSWDEVLKAANVGINNTGNSNSGDRNSGDRNSGDRNSGDSNSGNCNSGGRNSGDRNSGYGNSGGRNSGDRNSGDINSGNWNSGNRNSGDGNSGDSNSGDSNSGDGNSDYGNSGNWNSGDRNSGNCNSGDRNSGNWNSGDRNSGNCNSGNWNSGNWNSGDRNSGDSNSGYRNSGAFCIDDNPTILLFDKQTDIKVREWEESAAIKVMRLLEIDIWIDESVMTDAEKSAYPTYKTTGGFLKQKTMHEAWSDMWNNLDDESKKVFTDLPNFDADKFKVITGIEIKKEQL